MNMKAEKFKKLNISLPPDLHEWIKQKQADFKKENPLGKLDISPFIAHCIQSMKESEEKQSPVGRAGAKTLRPSESSVTLRSTATRGISRRAG